MAVQLDSSGKDDLKTQFLTCEGEYRLMTLSEYSRPNRVGYQNNQNSPQVRVSIVSLPSPPVGQLGSTANSTVVSTNINNTSNTSNSSSNNNNNNGASGGGGGGGGSNSSGSNSSAVTAAGNSNSLAIGKPQLFPNGLDQQSAASFATPLGGDRICFNYGKELYVYAYRGAKKATDLNKPIDKKLYKGTNPSCHDFNATAASFDGAPLLVGFSTGQIQLVHPGRREQGKLFNEERNIDKSKVTCLKWIPGSQNQFLVSHASGCIYLYNDELPCTPTTPNYQLYKGGDGYMILACKSKATKNPLFKWCFGQQENASINEFCFSPCGQHLAVVSQDGFLRIFHYDNMELIGIARSYFGGFLCVCWSPDGKYVVVGGEDDLVTVFSLHEQRVVARGQGHRSWVSVVAFDPYTTSYAKLDCENGSEDELPGNEGRYGSNYYHQESNCLEKNATLVDTNQTTKARETSAQNRLATCYRLGSVSQDTQICLWDITEDVLRQSFGRVIKPAHATNGNHSNKSDIAMNGLTNGEGDGKVMADKCSSKGGKQPHGPTADVVDNASFKLVTPTLGTIGNNLYNSSKPASSTFSNLNCDEKANSDSSSDRESIDSKLAKRANCIDEKVPPSVATAPPHANAVHSKKEKADKRAGGDTSSPQNHHHSQHSTFNSITQRLSNLSFGNSSGGTGGGGGSGGSGGTNSSEKSDKVSKNTSSKRSIISITGKSFSNNSNNSSLSNNSRVLNSASNNQIVSGSPSGGGGTGSSGSGGISTTITSIMTSSLTKSKHGGGSTQLGGGGCGRIVSSYDPMKLIGTPACPRFDDCPVLEPLVCKKIAHERLTALIFREDCFLTACQDGFVYTWARPGFVNIPQHLSSTPSAPPGGTVV